MYCLLAYIQMRRRLDKRGGAIAIEEQWEFFEHLDEFVYVTDMNTDEFVHMNTYLREALNISNPLEYQGKI